MKKILYFALFALVIVATYLAFQKQNQTAEATSSDSVEAVTTTTSADEEVAPTKETPDNCSCKTDCICPENDPDCECKQTKTICECTQPDGTVTVVESVDNNNEDIEELNPDETADQDETVVNE